MAKSKLVEVNEKVAEGVVGAVMLLLMVLGIVIGIAGIDVLLCLILFVKGLK